MMLRMHNLATLRLRLQGEPYAPLVKLLLRVLVLRLLKFVVLESNVTLSLVLRGCTLAM